MLENNNSTQCTHVNIKTSSQLDSSHQSLTKNAENSLEKITQLDVAVCCEESCKRSCFAGIISLLEQMIFLTCETPAHFS